MIALFFDGESPALSEQRRAGEVFLVRAGWAFTLFLAVAGLASDLPNMAVAVTASAIANLVPGFLVLSRRSGVQTRLSIGLMAALQPAALVYLLEAQAWQMDMHMYFFVALAALTLLYDWRAIGLSAVVVAVHHLLFSFIAPEWVFTGSGQFVRVVIHAVAVILQFAVLTALVRRMCALVIEHHDARQDSDALTADAEAQRDLAEAALAASRAAEARATEEAARRVEAEDNFRRQRQQAFQELSAAFEDSVAGVTNAVVSAATQMTSMAGQLSTTSKHAQTRANTMTMLAAGAFDSASQVATEIKALSASIAEIGLNTDRQSAANEAALAKVKSGTESMQVLAKTTTDVEQFVGMIRSIAGHTNLLALNATIEAARAGDAGKGFAVVADEVKKLAVQTDGATGQIDTLLAGISGGANEARQSIDDVSGSIEALAAAALAISSAVDEHERAASLIESNASEAASSAERIASDMRELTSNVTQTGQLSKDMDAAAGELMQSIGALKNATDRFIGHLRAA